MNKIILILIFILALFLRVYKLGQYPTGFLWDEAALGYNAYSILKTGRDEYGQILPVIFKSFGDYKPGLYVYPTIPSIAIFGLNEFAVRLPSAIAGSLTVIFLYLLLTEARFTQILSTEFIPSGERLRVNSKQFYTDSVPLVSALFLTLSPWHINFSRGAWELNVMLFEIIFGFFLLMKYLNSGKTWQLSFALGLFILSLFTYQSAKLLTPLLLIGFVFFFRRKIGKIPQRTRCWFLVAVLGGFFVFNLLTIFGGKAGRLKVMSIFSYPRSPEETEMIQRQDSQSKLFFALFHSSPIFFLRSVFGRYFNYFSGRFLFFEGDWSNVRNGTIYHGVMYYLDFLFLVVGLGYLLAKKRSEFKNFMLYWLVIAPFPAALTRDSISSVRSFPMVIPLIYIVAVGVNSAYDFFRKNRFFCFFRFLSPLILYSLFIIQLFLIGRFLDLYFIHDPIFTSKDRLYGYKEMIEFIKPLEKNQKKILITNKYGQPYIFYLFYTKHDPRAYQKIAKFKENPCGDVGEVEEIGKISFKKFYWPDERGNENSLFVGDEFDLPLTDIVGQEKINFLKEINFLNGKTAFRIVETK